jgi:hypothetical protein
VGGDAREFVRIVNSYLVLTKPDPRGFLIEAEKEVLDVPQNRDDYLRWWRERFFV